MHKSTRSELHVARLWDVAPLDGLTLLGYEADALRNTIRAIDGGGRLRSLELRFTTIEAVSALAELGGLRELILAGVQGGDPAEVLASGTNLTGLRTLIFDSCRISDFGASELRRSVFAARLERLEMISCGLTDRVAYELIGGFSASNSLTRLDLSQNRFSGSARNELENRFAGALVINTGDRPWPMRYYL
jgi:Leucine-rich repeat (LRR) protein